MLTWRVLWCRLKEHIPDGQTLLHAAFQLLHQEKSKYVPVFRFEDLTWFNASASGRD